MATNIFAGRFTVIHAKTTQTFADAGLNSGNTIILYEIGQPNKSWKPANSLNSLTNITAGNGYMIKTSADLDNANFYPPFPSGGGGLITLS